MPTAEQHATQPNATSSSHLSPVSGHPIEAVCLHPTCMKSCEYRVGTRGQKRLFCSTECSLDYHATRKNLLKEIAELDARIAAAGPRSNVGHLLSQQRKHVAWHLRRYGG